MPYVEDVIAEQEPKMWGEYLPKSKSVRGLKTKGCSCVMVRNVGCVFIGTVEQCQEYIRENEWRYEKTNSRRLLTR